MFCSLHFRIRIFYSPSSTSVPGICIGVRVNKPYQIFGIFFTQCIIRNRFPYFFYWTFLFYMPVVLLPVDGAIITYIRL